MTFRTYASDRVTIDGSGNLVVGGTSFSAAGSFGVEANGHIRTVLASGTTGDTLLGGISGVNNGFQITTDSSNNQTYKFHNGSAASLTIDSSGGVDVTGSLGIGGGSTDGVQISQGAIAIKNGGSQSNICLLYTSDAADE